MEEERILFKFAPEQKTEEWRELSHREGDGYEVKLLWRQDEAGDVLRVDVDDWRTDEHFEVMATPENALDVFNHPFAYRRGGEVALRAA